MLFPEMFNIPFTLCGLLSLIMSIKKLDSLTLLILAAGPLILRKLWILEMSFELEVKQSL